MAAIIGVIQAKGGVGRSTITTNLAGTFSLHAPTVLIDCDLPQGTSSSWFALRQADLPTANLSLALARDCRELVAVTKQFFPTHQYIFIDGPPRLAEMTRAILMLSTLCLVPLGASAAELWSTADLLQTITEAGVLRKDLDVRLVWNRFRGQTREARDLRAAVNRELPLAELRTTLSYRVAYSEAMARGLTADEWLDQVAHEEVRSLAAEIKEIVGERTP
ncbi:MAG TPA: ParA family protein [Geobacteraceae bacterium]